MTSPIIAYKFAEMQHAEYEAQVSQFPSTETEVDIETETNEGRQGLILGRIAALIRQKREQFAGRFSKRQIAEAS